ncbi:hypothetical protein HZB88_00245, partial [archaeon]|nr:hypothetical protein [archaeon]
MKAQTALEYLMTYGWAILIVVIVIGALYGLGLTKPCKWTGTQVREFPDFTVANPKYTATGGFAIDVSRLKPDTVSVTGLQAKQSTATTWVVNSTNPPFPKTMS